MGYMFFYSERPGTLAARRYQDDIPLEREKKTAEGNRRTCKTGFRWKAIAATSAGSVEVLIEGDSKKSELEWMGRTSENKVVVFPKAGVDFKKGDYAIVEVIDCNKATLIGRKR